MTGRVYGEISVRDYLRATSTRRRRVSSRKSKAALVMVCMLVLGYVAGALLPLGSFGTPARAAVQEPAGEPK